MSRGFGKAQRFVLERLEADRADDVEPWRRWRSAPELAEARSESAPTVAEVESIRRAIRSLAASGNVEMRHTGASWEGKVPRTAQWRKWDEEAGHYTDEFETTTYLPLVGGRLLLARLPLTEEEQAAEQAEEAERSRRIAEIFNHG